MKYSVKKGVIHSKKGIPAGPRWFADGRLSFEFSEYGITRVHYMYPYQCYANHTLFYQRLWDGFRYYIEKDGLNYKPEFTSCQVWPFGIEAKWLLHGQEFTHRVMAIDEAIVIQLGTPADVSPGALLKLEFYEAFALVPCDSSDFRMANMGADRRWKDWSFDQSNQCLLGGFIDKPKNGQEGVDMEITIQADFHVRHAARGHCVKHALTGAPIEPEKTYTFLIRFTHDGDAIEKSKQQLAAIRESIARQFARYQAVALKSPVLKSPYKDLNDFISLGPQYHEAVKIPAIPGALRASNVHYWVWGWDGMTSNYCTAYWGDTALIRDMLDLYERTADLVSGIVHAFRYDMTVASVSALPAQGMYICLLQLYYAATGDLETVRKHYAFARKTFERVASKESGDTGFCLGTSLFPDFPGFMQETGDDLSTFNNMVFYCAARSMDYLASLMDDREGQCGAEHIFKKMEASFSSLFFDGEKAFIVSSVDSRTLEKRQSYNLGSLKWENSYLSELLGPVAGRCMGFIEKHLVSRAGLRETPVWSEAFDGDANQLHCWWPVNSEYFIRTANDDNRADLIQKFIGYIQHWTGKLTCPEGIPYYIETEDPDSDRWNTLQGAWQSYSIRGWYQAVIHGVVGVGVEAGGITFYPYDGEEMSLSGFNYMGRRLDIHMKGSGRFIERIEANGNGITGTNKLPVDVYGTGKKVKVTVYRTRQRPCPAIIKTAYGVSLSDFKMEGGIIEAQMQGEGTCRVNIHAVKKPKVKINGMEQGVLFDNELSLAMVPVCFSHGDTMHLEIV